MSKDKKAEPLVEYIDTPAAAPLEVPCVKWQQAGFDVYSGLCPKCRPGVSLKDIGDRIKTEGHGHIHINDQGTIVCKCGAYLKLTLKE